MLPLLKILCEIVERQNWIFVSILVPISVAYDLFDCGKSVYFKLLSLMRLPIFRPVCYLLTSLSKFHFLPPVRNFVDQTYARLNNINHYERLQQIQEQLKIWRELPNRKLLCTARPSWKSISLQPMVYKDKMHKVSVLKYT